MLVDNKVPFSNHSSQIRQTYEFLTRISPSKNASKLQHLHSCFHLDFIVFNHRWISLLNCLYISLHSTSEREKYEGKNENQIDFAWFFRFYIFSFFSLGAWTNALKRAWQLAWQEQSSCRQKDISLVRHAQRIFPLFPLSAEFSRVDFLVRYPSFNQNPMEKSWQKQTFNSTK